MESERGLFRVGEEEGVEVDRREGVVVGRFREGEVVLEGFVDCDLTADPADFFADCKFYQDSLSFLPLNRALPSLFFPICIFFEEFI